MGALDRFNEFVQTHGRWLMEEMNWDLWLLSKADALKALELLESEPIKIHGGDAFFQGPDGRPEYGVSLGRFDSFWRTDCRPNETFEECCARSKLEARRFIEAFTEDAPGFIGIEFNASELDDYTEILKRKKPRDSKVN